MKILKLLAMYLSLIFAFNYLFQPAEGSSVNASLLDGYVMVEDFGANGMDYVDDSAALQQAIDYAEQNQIGKVKLTGQREYLLKKSIILKQDVEMEMDQNTKLLIDGNFRAIELQKNASITNGIIMVVNPAFTSQVIYLDGKYKFGSWERTRVDNVTIVNASESYKGTALQLYAAGDGHYVTYVNFTDLKILNFQTGIQLRAVKPAAGYSWVNANRFENITLDNCVRYIELIGSKTIPNEASGNQFRSLQVQVEAKTVSVLRVSGQDNSFDMMVWDVSKAGSAKVMELTPNSVGTRLEFNLSASYVSDAGVYTVLQTPYP